MDELEVRKEIVARPYQLRLLEHAIAHNSIIYLPTGSGKTYIAILLIRHFSKNLGKPIEEGGKRCAFICNTVELARQNVKEIANTTNFKVGLFVGDLNVDNWGDDKWKEEINKNQILVGTSQVFVDMVTHRRLSITDFSCIVIDECHHATKSHPMHQLLSFLQYSDQTRLPRVVGLTGVLIKSSKSKEIMKLELLGLEAAFRGKIITVMNCDELHNVMLYSTSPNEQLLKYIGDGRIFDVEEQINSIIQQCLNQNDNWDLGDISKKKYSKNFQSVQQPSKIKQIKSMFMDFQHQMNDMGLYAASIGILGLIVQFEINKRNSETIALRNMYRYVITKCEHIRHILVKKIKSFFSDDEDDDMDEADIILNFSKPKLQALLGFFAREFSSKKATDINCLLFVERRFTAKCLCYVIKNFASVYKGLSHIIPEFMVGRNIGTHYSLDTLLDSKWNRQAVQRFHRKECNLIVCSSVLEEGIDIQACNYVISFDPIKQFSSYVQMKGRARFRESMYVVLCENFKEHEVTEQIGNYKKIDSYLKNYLITRTIDREVPDISQTMEQFSNIIKPFVVESGAILQPESALMLLNRYCNTLPVDTFTQSAPVWETETRKDVYRIALHLPLQSTIKDVIYSDPMKSIRWAKISAAFKACVQLYKNGELNANLHPVTKKQILENISDIYFDKWKNEINDENKDQVGTKKSHRIYNKIYPEELTGAIPKINKISYAYYIVIEPDFDSNEENAYIIEMLNSKSNYAIVVKDKLPNLAAMPLFMTQGQVNVKIISTPIEIVIKNDEELTKLKTFNKMLFTDIRNHWQKFLAISNQNGRNSFLIAPIKYNSAIDWKIVNSFQKINPLRATTMTERSRKNTYLPEDYLGKVVNVWYAIDEDVRFVVTKIRHDLTPLSTFPENKYKNFAEFVENKYGEKVMNEKQFLIEVKALTSRSNFFVNAAGKASGNKRAKKMNVILIPEMCHNFRFPGDLWLKALFLPCILHRLHYLLIAEKIRIDINRYLVISDINYNPAPIEIDYSLRRIRAEDKSDEHRSMLPALDTTQRDSSMNQIHNLVDVDEGNWKAYMEPADVNRNLNAVYPIEIDYYYQFVNGLLVDMERLDLNDTNIMQVSMHNLEAHKPNPGVAVNTLVKKLTNTSLDSGRTIDLLEISWITNIKTAEQYEFLAAITTASTNDVFDMERYEVLGDSFLKFSASLLLMHRHKSWNEGFLTAVKSRMVSNRNLLYCMRAKFDGSFICSSSFEPKSEWLPPMAAVPTNIWEAINAKVISPMSLYELDLSEEEINSGMCSVETVRKTISSNQLSDTSTDCLNEFIYKQSIADKVLADCLEALLGVCVKNYGVQKSFEMLDYFGIYRDPEKKLLPILLDTNLITPLLRSSIAPSEVDEYLINYTILEENLKYKFKDRAYLLQAVTHPSFPTNRLTGCYQQLEFIGDAVLDFLVSCYIFEKCQHMNPGQITDLRSALVNNVTLACVCVRNHFHQYMLYESPSLSESIRKFVEFQNSQNHKITAQVKILLEETVSMKAFNMAENVDVPKALGDILEAIIGAVFLDSGNDLRRTWQVISNLIDYELTEFIANVPIDPIRQLYEYRGANPKFQVSSIENDVVLIKCTFYCRDFVKTVVGCGGNKAMAKKAAAKMALQILQKN